MDNRTKIVSIIRHLATKPIDPAADESLFESGLLDSFSLNDLVTALESEFAIQVPDSDLTPRKFDSIERIEAYVESHS
ncbi:MAG TPA: acyl carrier protein [Bryobacteraceae bacterium]|nr:acyl carrier protein [Bryobacteraceae bacterium]